MLTLSRKSNETIRIGEDICIHVKRIEGDVVRLGIDAPQSVAIYRGEIYDDIQSRNLKAAAGTSPGQSDLKKLRIPKATGGEGKGGKPPGE